MASSRFDRLARSLGARSSRRAAIAGAAAGLGGLALHGATGGTASAQPATPAGTPTAGTSPTFLFVQTFTSATLTPDAERPNHYRLTLSGAPASTIAFADRPARLTDALPTGDLPQALSFDAGDPPNAALLARTDADEEIVLIIELLDPAYDPATRTASYRVRELADYGGIGSGLAAAAQPLANAPSTFGITTLFIDSGSGCMEPVPIDCNCDCAGSSAAQPVAHVKSTIGIARLLGNSGNGCGGPQQITCNCQVLTQRSMPERHQGLSR